MEIAQLIEWLELRYPNRLPTKEQTPYEQGVLQGQRALIESIKIKVGATHLEQEEIK